MNIAMTSVTFRQYSVEEVILYAKKAGLYGIEWAVCDNHVQLGNTERLDEIIKLSAQNNIEIISLGAYCDMSCMAECDKVLETAAYMHTPIIRVWPGGKSSAECDDEYRALIVANSAEMGEKAAKHGIKIGFEYHGNTLTDTADSAVRLVGEIGKKNVGLYWQQNSMMSVEENIKNLKTVRPFLVGNIHVQNYTPQGGYMPLCDIEDKLSKYFSEIKSSSYNIIIEFVKDALPESLYTDTETLRKIIY